MSVELQQALGVNTLARRIREEGELLSDGSMLRVADFLNQKVDAVLMDSCGAMLAAKLRDAKPTKVMTGISCQGLLPAASVARHLGLPLIFAHPTPPAAWKSTKAYSAKWRNSELFVSSKVIGPEDKIAIIDDIFATGMTCSTLASICRQAGATITCVGVIIHNKLQPGSVLAARQPNCGFAVSPQDVVSLVQVSPIGDVHPSTGCVSFEVSPPPERLVVPPSVAADVLTERIKRDGQVLPGNLLKVYAFVNHQVDTRLMDMCGELLARVFAGFGVQKVLTAQTGGLPPAHAVAKALRVPLICARETHDLESPVLSTSFSATSESFTKKRKLALYVERDCFQQGDVVLVVDDFLATGTTGVALHHIVEQANAVVAGMAFLIEKRFQDGRGKIINDLPHMNGKIVSLASIQSMDTEIGIELDQTVVGKCSLLVEPPTNVMIKRVMQSARPSDEGSINVSSFVNHVVDASLMDHAAVLLARRFGGSQATVVLTAESSGVAPALSLALRMRLPLICARRKVNDVMAKSGDIISADVQRDGTNESDDQRLHILSHHLGSGDKVLIVDDILSSAATALALHDLCEQVGACIVGIGFLVEKAYNGGRDKILDKIPQLTDNVVALTKVLSVGDQEMNVFRCSEDARATCLRIANDLSRRMSAEVVVDVPSNVMKFRSLLGFTSSMDPVLLDTCGQALAAQFCGITKVLTGASIQGLAVAHVVARHLDVPMIFSRTSVPLTMKGQTILTSEAPAGNLNVSAEFVTESDRVLIVDDFLEAGSTAAALKRMCEQVGAAVGGFAFLARNFTQFYGQRSETSESTVESLKGAKIVYLVEVRGGDRGGPIQIEVADWLQRLPC